MAMHNCNHRLANPNPRNLFLEYPETPEWQHIIVECMEVWPKTVRKETVIMGLVGKRREEIGAEGQVER